MGVSVLTTKTRSVLVIGAAGHQGSAVLRHLSEHGLEAQVLLDDRGEGEAHGLPWQRAETARLDDAVALDHAFRDAGALFVVLDDPQSGPDERLRNGLAIADAAARAGIEHVVYSADTGPDHHRIACDRSRAIEERLRSLRVPLTVLRPTTVMEEIAWYWLSRYGSKLVLATPFAAQSRLPLIAVDDIAGLAVTALAAPADFLGRTIAIAGEVSSPAAIASLLSLELREPVASSEVQVEGVFIYPEVTTAATTDIAWLRSVYPGLHTLRSWLEEGGGLALCHRAAAHPAA
jgi:uncharacterized protein YbjT (DUF2867 family)